MSRLMRTAIFLPILLVCTAVSAEITIQSGVTQNNLVELYTSEGCSSCPPADQWLSTLKADPSLWQDLVPVAFHVDYWDYNGWKDRYAHPDFADRQRTYAAQSSVTTVYTPGLMSNGEEWRNFGWLAPTLAEEHEVGLLKAVIGDDNVVINFQPQAESHDENLVAYVALLGFELTSDVQAGENAGRELKHDFVVLGFAEKPMTYDDGSYHLTIERPRSETSANKYGIALWVSRADRQIPIQAAGGWIDQ